VSSSTNFIPQTEVDSKQSMSLPAWIYSDEKFFALERERIFMRSWQIVCHSNDIPNSGDYFVLNFMGESAYVVRGKDNVIRGFYNVCRHRAARLLDGEDGLPSGNCKANRIACPYHAWTYDLDGRLMGLPYEDQYQNLNKADWGLFPVEVELWMGFVFIRFESSSESVAQMMSPFADELRPYRFEEMRALGRVTMRSRDVNWKNITDNYVDGLHINVAHPGLRSIAGRTYKLDETEYVHRMTASIEPTTESGWSERMYSKLLPEQSHLPEERRRAWAYYMMWPNIALDVYPDQIDFMQMIPVSPTETMIREIPYALPNESRNMRVTRHLNWRINRQVNEEDRTLIERVQEGMASRRFTQGPLSDAEVCLNGFARRMRQVLPISKLPTRPEDMSLSDLAD
jgi:phenylpropionate dioxygenase-like ring-hydroxylating dioxygenase large terminal subunit